MTDPKLILGDAIDEMKKMSSASFDAVIADPPYNLGKDYGNNHDTREFEEYLAFTREWTSEAKRLLKESGTLYVFMGFRFISYVYDVLDREFGMEFVNWIVWHYTQGMGKKRGFSPRHDDVLMFGKTKKYKFNLDDVRVPQKYYRDRNNMRGANPGDVWQFSHVHYCNENRQAHPTQKPEGLIERMVRASTDAGDVVLDPFFGSGTSLRVCQQLGRECVGIEVNPEFVELARSRLDEPFEAFDSIDPRMKRVPRDLRRDDVRNEYLENHRKWFLNCHSDAQAEFESEVQAMYGQRDRQRSLDFAD